MARLDPPPSLKKVTVHAKGGPAYLILSLFAVLYALAASRLLATAGEPYATAELDNKRIRAISYLQQGFEYRSRRDLQAGLLEAAELPTFNSTLFDECQALLRSLKLKVEALDKAKEAEEVSGLEEALLAAVELHTDGRPVVHSHARSARDTLRTMEERERRRLVGEGREAEANELEKRLNVTYSRVAEALAMWTEASEIENEIMETKLPSKWLPSFWVCAGTFLLGLCTALFFLFCHWSTLFKSLVFYHPTSSLLPTSILRVVPHKHRGKPALVPLVTSSTGALHFTFQRQKYSILPTPTGSAVGIVAALRCPTDLPIRHYSSTNGLGRAEIAQGQELHGANSFAIPMPSFGELYREQLSSPIAIFQLFCCVLWMLDEYWKYTLFTLGMILIFEATTAFSRQRNMMTLRGMSNKAFPLLAFRQNSWLQVIPLIPTSHASPLGFFLSSPRPLLLSPLFLLLSSLHAIVVTPQLSCVSVSVQAGFLYLLVQVQSTDLLPGDLISLTRALGNDTTLVPADCLLLRGTAVVNESTLTGESVPQMKDAIASPDAPSHSVEKEWKVEDGGERLDIKSLHQVHTLFSGTMLMQHSNTRVVDGGASEAEGKEAGSRVANCPDVPDPPDGGCVCCVLATAFSSSQGELMRMIEFSTAQVTADKKETIGLLSIDRKSVV